MPTYLQHSARKHTPCPWCALHRPNGYQSAIGATGGLQGEDSPALDPERACAGPSSALKGHHVHFGLVGQVQQLVQPTACQRIYVVGPHTKRTRVGFPACPAWHVPRDAMPHWGGVSHIRRLLLCFAGKPRASAQPAPPRPGASLGTLSSAPAKGPRRGGLGTPHSRLPEVL